MEKAPVYIQMDSTVVFSPNNEHILSIRQTTDTSIWFSLTTGNDTIKGRARLHPHYNLGAETVSFSEGTYYIHQYFVYESNNPCLYYVGIGDQNVVAEETEEIYAVIGLIGDNCDPELVQMAGKKLNRIK